MKFFNIIFLHLMLVVCSFRCDNKAYVTSLGEHKIVDVEIPVRNFEGIQEAKFSTLKIRVLDTSVDSVKSIFEELSLLEGVDELPIYCTSCYNGRNIAGTNTLSKHAYGAAIDVYYYMNPHADIINNKMTPDMRGMAIDDIAEDLLECTTTIPSDKMELFVQKYIMQEKESDDAFVNRLVHRPGMTNEFHAKIFKKYGFNRWGGYWRQPMDFMHFEISSRALINNIIASDQETAQKLWNEHIEKCREELKAQNEKEQKLLEYRIKSLGI